MIQSAKVRNLSLSSDNVRKNNREADLDALAANIAAQGLLQNLVVMPLKKANHFTVKAGGRRLRALKLLIERGVLPADHEVQVLVLNDNDVSIEASLSENFHRVPMNPADECTAFKHFIDKGASAEDVAKRFGVTTRFVEGRVRLAELAPCVFDALAAGEITLGSAQAYAVTTDVDRQTHVFKQMAGSYYGDNPDNIKRAILNGAIKPTDAKARFVGRDAYIAAGGRIERDLFASADDESWTDSELVEELANTRLTDAAVALQEANGFAFVIPVVSNRVPYDLERQYHSFRPIARDLTDEEQVRVDALAAENDDLVEQLETVLGDESPEGQAANARLEAIERELDEINAARVSISPEIMAQLGTFVFMGQDHDVRVHSGYFSERPVVDPNAPKAVAGPVDGSGAAGDAEEADVGVKLSQALTDELATQRRQILVAHVASDPALALDLAIFMMAQKITFPSSFLQDHSTLRADAASFPIFGFRDEDSLATETIDEQAKALDKSWAVHKTMDARFDAFRALTEEARGAWIGYAVARTLEPTLNIPDGGRVNGFHDHLGRLLDIKVEQWWRPTADNYFGRVKKDVILDALDEIGGPALRARYKDAKKGELAKTAASLCDGKGIVEAEVREKATTWLPEAMRFEKDCTPDRFLSYSAEIEDEDEESGDIDDAEIDADAEAPLDDTDDGEGEDFQQAA